MEKRSPQENNDVLMGSNASQSGKQVKHRWGFWKTVMDDRGSRRGDRS